MRLNLSSHGTEDFLSASLTDVSRRQPRSEADVPDHWTFLNSSRPLLVANTIYTLRQARFWVRETSEGRCNSVWA
jgi:hypothetical protein